MRFEFKIDYLFKKMQRINKQTWLITGSCLILIIILLVAILPKSVNIATAEVKKGDFIIDVKVRGEIDALHSTNVSVPRMRRRMSLQIVDMVPEGSVVKKGDFLFQLDPSQAQQQMDEVENELANTEAQLESEKATIVSNMAQLKSQLETQKYSYEQSKLKLKMMQFEAETKKQEVEINMKKAEVSLAQAEQKIASQKIIDKASLMKAELKVRQAEAKLKEAQRALEALTITAPLDGLVVYQEIWSGSEMKKVEVGDTPWHGMAVMKIPDLSVMQAKTTVNEVEISKIKEGQNVVVTVDALGGKDFYGRITRVAALARRERSINVKVFDVEVTLDSTDGQLRPGMTCECKIITNRIKDVLSIPLQAVFQKEGNTVVYVMGSRKPRMEKVKLGEKSTDTIVVLEGLEQGDRVCLRDPTIPLEEIGGEGETVAPKADDKIRK